MSALVLAMVWVALGLALHTRPQGMGVDEPPAYLRLATVFSWPFFLALGYYAKDMEGRDQ